MGTDVFFPIGESDDRAIEFAKKVCGRCPVTEECLSYALETNQGLGVWGGLTARERRSLRRRMRREAAG